MHSLHCNVVAVSWKGLHSPDEMALVSSISSALVVLSAVLCYIVYCVAEVKFSLCMHICGSVSCVARARVLYTHSYESLR